MYDMIAIEAGPAGSTVAKTLADKGYKVFLVEKIQNATLQILFGIDY